MSDIDIDIVARLRSAAKDKDNMPRMKSETMLTVGLGLEAADEIERLRLESAGSNQLVKAGEIIDRQAKEIEHLKDENKVWTDRFAKHDYRVSVAVEAERERCAKVAETTEREGFGGGAYNEAGRDIAAAIRNQDND